MDKVKKILIIEDEKPLARALELKLVHEGLAVVSISSGEGLEGLLKKEDFSLIVCDLVMPKVDGFQVLELLKDKGIKIPVIILTNLSQAEDEKRAKELGATDFFIKSNTPIAEVVSHVKKRVGT